LCLRFQLQTEILLEKVLELAVDPARRLYALLDGARFDDLPGMLTAAGVSHRSLYRNVQDAELVRAGPWLVDPYRKPDPGINAWGGLPPMGSRSTPSEDFVAADTKAALSETLIGGDDASNLDADIGDVDPKAQVELTAGIVGDLPAAVFWIGSAELTEARLWHHLRTLNMVLIPRGYGEEDFTPPVEQGGETHEAVMFRHADGNVLAEVLPVLNAAQFSRVFGPARALLFSAPDHPASDGSTLRRASLPDDAPLAAPGLLQLSIEQMEGIEAARLERSRRKVMIYLNEFCPGEAEELSDAELRDLIVQYEASGDAIGLKSERAHMKWAYLMSLSNGELAGRPETRNFFAESPKHPDDRIDDLMDVFDGAWNSLGGVR
jgi:hypothetical protein